MIHKFIDNLFEIEKPISKLVEKRIYIFINCLYFKYRIILFL